MIGSNANHQIWHSDYFIWQNIVRTEPGMSVSNLIKALKNWNKKVTVTQLVHIHLFATGNARNQQLRWASSERH